MLSFYIKMKKLYEELSTYPDILQLSYIRSPGDMKKEKKKKVKPYNTLNQLPDIRILKSSI